MSRLLHRLNDILYVVFETTPTNKSFHERKYNMPKIKPYAFEERNRIVRSCIAANQERYAITNENLAKLLGVTPQTIRNRKKKPETFTLWELHALSRTLKFTPIQAASIVLGRDLTAKEVKDFILM